MTNLEDALAFLSLPDACPLCIVALNPENGHPVAVNSTFESVLGPLYKFVEWEFADAASADVNPNSGDDASNETNRSRFRDAINSVRRRRRTAGGGASSAGGDATGEEDHQETLVATTAAASSTAKIRNVEMLALGTNDAGLPIRRHFDWTIGSVAIASSSSSSSSKDDDCNSGLPSSVVVMYGDVVNEAESSDRARDAELIDFFQNAPIAMHWLNGEGIVLWANQTELNVLGYTAEEYIGKPIMNFCPDESDLVLEIFKQLGSGNAIADVPVRFRTKDGRIVHLLIDSNVAYNKDGSFGHTRCFIRDDTARKVRDARTKLLLEETERSLRMLDGFLSRTLHHVMGPLHALRGTCEVVRDRIQMQMQQSPHYGGSKDDEERNCKLLERAADTVTTTTRMVADVSDLARFDEGASLRVKVDSVDLRSLGVEAIEGLQFNALRLSGGDDGISVSLDLVGAGGPSAVRTDGAVLLRVLAHLLENAVREVGLRGTVKLRITSGAGASGGTLVEVIDDGNGLPTGTCLDNGDVSGGKYKETAPIHRYLIGGRRRLNDLTNDPDDLLKVRIEMEEKLRDLRQNGVGVGLPLSYHLVRSLGGDLRHDTNYAVKGTRIWFFIPTDGDMGEEVAMCDTLTTETIPKNGIQPPASIIIDFRPGDTVSGYKRMRTEENTFANFCSDSSTTSGDETLHSLSPTLGEPAPLAVAKCGVKASMPFSVLIVEDTDISARLLAMQLKKLKCSTQRAENGRVAIDILKESLPGTFDMVLMDLRMPVMDGLEATKLIRHELDMKYLPVVALTGEMSADIRQECEEIGFDDFFQKPLKKDVLEAIVNKYKASRDGVEL